MKLVDKAIMFAKAAHQNQMRDDNVTPYYTHLLNVAENLKNYGVINETILSAAILHDIIEDTAWSYHDVEKEFGKEIADLVAHCSDDTRLPSTKRFDDMILHVSAMPFNAMLIKLADILDNVGDMSTWKPKRRKKYVAKKQQVLDVMRCYGSGIHNHSLYKTVQDLINRKRYIVKLNNDKPDSETENLKISISNAECLIEKNRAKISNLEDNIDAYNKMLAKWNMKLFVKKHERDCNG